MEWYVSRWNSGERRIIIAWQSYTVAKWLALKKSGIATIGIGTTVSHEEEWHSGLPRIRGALKFSISPEDQNEIRTSSALRQNSNRGSFLFGEIQFKRPSRIENFFVLPGQSFKRFPIKKIINQPKWRQLLAKQNTILTQGGIKLAEGLNLKRTNPKKMNKKL